MCGGYMRAYGCGHSFFEPLSSESAEGVIRIDPKFFKSISGKFEAFDFQKEGIEFIHKTNFNCLIADPMGLGKTIQALLAARCAFHLDGTPRFKTILVVVKSATTYQWLNESKEWFSPDLWGAFIIQGTKAFIPPGFRIYIISMDLLGRFMNAKNGGLKALHELGIDLVIVDECHSFKNPSSARSIALIEFLQNISFEEIVQDVNLSCSMCAHTWTEQSKLTVNRRKQTTNRSFRHESKCPECTAKIVVYQDREDTGTCSKGLIMLSGTPIKNRADEFFVPFNLLRPDIFPSFAAFRRKWLAQDPNTGKYTRIQPYLLDEFRRITAQFMIRREKNQVLSLPPFRRTFEAIYIEDERIKGQYNKALADLDAITRHAHDLRFFEIQESLMTLRRITGMAKVPFAVEYIDTFLDTVEDEKIAIGIHHEAVRDAIYYALQQSGIPVLKLSGEDSAENKNRIVQKFQLDPKYRVLVVNMLAGGVGLNLQACNNVLCLERQWNAADEEQFECRFNRQGQKLPVLAEYMLAAGTIDTYFSALVEEKRQICGESLDGWDFGSDPNALRELVEKTLGSRL